MRRKTAIKITENRSVEAGVKAISQEFGGGPRRGGDWWFPLGRMDREPACKPGSVENGHSSGTRVAACLERPTRKHPRTTGCGCESRLLPYLALLRVGFTLPLLLPAARCALTAPFHPYRSARADRGGMFSVALSVGSHPPGVTWHPVLRSPDFPPPPQHGESDHPADSRIQDSGSPPRAQARTRP